MRIPLCLLGAFSLIGWLWSGQVAAAPAPAPWQTLSNPNLSEVAAQFPHPPAEYGSIHWAIWGGEQSRERILADLDRLAANGASVYMINNSRGLRPAYFTPEYLDLVKFTVAECKQRGMKVWIEDDAGYPSGFAGGLISQKHPELAMQGIVADVRYSVVAGETLDVPMPPGALGALAYNRGSGECRVLPLAPPANLRWTAPGPGTTEVTVVRHIFRSSPTRYTNRADGTNDKDSLYSLIDYLNPEATRTYLSLIHETYARIVGDEFGKTILGFRGDEPDYTGFLPWTPRLLELFHAEKGYDLLPYLPQFFAPDLSVEVQRVKADYWDVWSGLFRDNFFKPQQEWCVAHGLEYMVHLNHEELMIDLARGEDLVRNEGDFFRAMRYVGVPGIDNLGQIGRGIVADFPKLAADAAHLFGRPQVWSEEGGGLGQVGKYVADYQFVRGVNFLQIRGINFSPGSAAKPLLNSSAAIAHYVNRASYLLTMGRPGAQVALYHPTDSMWLGDHEANDVNVRLTTELLEHQIDFDAIDGGALDQVCSLEDGGLKNLSGQIYRAIIIPSSTTISLQRLERLRQFSAAGGKVIFIGRTPNLVVDHTFLRAAKNAPDLSFAQTEPSPHITDKVVAMLPPAAAVFGKSSPAIKIIHRVLRDADVYFLFNESGEAQVESLTLGGRGTIQEWNATDGVITTSKGLPPAEGHARISLRLESAEAKFVVIGPLSPGAREIPGLFSSDRENVAARLNGDWSIELDKSRTTTLQSWEMLGVNNFSGIGHYVKQFDLPTPIQEGKPLLLDLGEVHELAKIRINGMEFPAQAWPPYRWDVSAALLKGANRLEVDIQVPTMAGFGGGFGGGPPGGGRGRARGGPAGVGPSDGGHGLPGTPPPVSTGVPGGLTRAEFMRPPSREVSGGPVMVGGVPVAPNLPPTSGLLGPVVLIIPQ